MRLRASHQSLLPETALGQACKALAAAGLMDDARSGAAGSIPLQAVDAAESIDCNTVAEDFSASRK